MENIIKKNKVFWVVIFLAVTIDLFSKFICVHYFDYGDRYTIIKDFFSITLSKNDGIAFSMFEGRVQLVITLTIMTIFGIVYYVVFNERHTRFECVSYGLIVGGAIGNLFDRIFYGYVIDFLDFNILGYDYPIFNLADSFIVIGVFVLLIFSFKKESEE